MDLRLVSYFVAVIDHGGVTKAAQALFIAQPSLSQAIRSLERQLGVELFDRSGRRLTLTADGQSFSGPARQILADVERARSKVHEVRDLDTGRLNIAVLSTLSADPLPELTSRLHQSHPGILLSVLDPGSSSGVASRVRKGEAELGLTDLPVKSDTLQTRELWDQEIALVLPPDLAEGLPDPVPLEALKEIPLVLESSGSGAEPRSTRPWTEPSATWPSNARTGRRSGSWSCTEAARPSCPGRSRRASSATWWCGRWCRRSDGRSASCSAPGRSPPPPRPS